MVEEEVVDYLCFLECADEIVSLPLEGLTTAEAGINLVVFLFEFSSDEQHAGEVAVSAAADKGYEEA